MFNYVYKLITEEIRLTKLPWTHIVSLSIESRNLTLVKTVIVLCTITISNLDDLIINNSKKLSIELIKYLINYNNTQNWYWDQLIGSIICNCVYIIN